MQDIHPISGWVLNFVVHLDVAHPGLAGAYLRASDERRQVIAALLATQPRNGPSLSGGERLAELMLRATHRTILNAAFGSVPVGLRGALARSGSEPHPRAYYRGLFRVLSDPNETKSAAVIRRLDRVDFARLRITQTLPAEFRMRNLVPLIDSVRMASDIARIAGLFSANGINITELSSAVENVSSGEQLAALWDRWAQKIPFPPHPLPASAQFSPARSGADLRRLALKFRNCARRYLPQALHGDDAFGEFIWKGENVIIHLNRTDGAWGLSGMFDKNNMPVDPEIYSVAARFLEQHQVKVLRTDRTSDGEWSPLRRLSRPGHFWH